MGIKRITEKMKKYKITYDSKALNRKDLKNNPNLRSHCKEAVLMKKNKFIHKFHQTH